MNVPETPPLARRLLDVWQAELRSVGLAPDPALLEAWGALLVDGDVDDELEGLVALHARALGEAGRPPSQAVLIVHLLEGAAASIGLGRARAARLVAVAADAHAVGAATRLTRGHIRRLREQLPVLALPGGRVLACLVGPIEAELLDLLLGRAFTLAVGVLAKEVVLDVSGAERPDEGLLLDTVVGFERHELASRLRLVLSGVDDPATWTQRVLGRGVHPDRLVCVARLAELEGGG